MQIQKRVFQFQMMTKLFTLAALLKTGWYGLWRIVAPSFPMRRFLLLTLLVGMLPLVGCVAKRTSGLDEKKPLEPPRRDTFQSLYAQGEAAWLERADSDRLIEAIVYFKKAHEADTSNREVLVRLSRACYFLADGYLTEPNERLARYDQGAYFGEKAMMLNPEFKQKLNSGVPLIDALAVAGVQDLEAVYWTASNLGKWSKLKGTPTILANKELIQRMLETINTLDETFYYAATSRYWGAFYAAAPSFAGGDLKKSREYFDKAMRIAPEFFAIKLLMAEMYCPKVKDRKLFRQLLTAVVEQDAQILPDVVAEQKVEQRKARELLARESELFDR
ncbi:MAG: TRAP transporter TatT component family protein [Myxococcota bacterium]